MYYHYDFMKDSSARGATRMKVMEANRDRDDAAGETKQEATPLRPRNMVTKDLLWRPEQHPPDHYLDPSTEEFCNSCRRLLQGTGTEAIDLIQTGNDGVFFEHLDIHFLEKSARNGCTICAIIWNSYILPGQAPRQAEEIPLRYDYGQFVGSEPQSFAVKFYPFGLLETNEQQMMPLLMPVITLTLEPCRNILSTQPTHTRISEDGNSMRESMTVKGTSSTGSPEVMAQIAKWLEKCSCISSAGPAFVPERLIDVGTSRSDKVCIVEGSTISDASRYIALSHCWGNMESGLANSSKLVQSNIDDFMSGIPLNGLPKTFSDAVTVTRYLGVRYLWIDSMCIVQDSKEDWERNAAMMWEVYTKAYVTLAATASRDSSQGLFRTRLAATIRPCIVNIPENNGKLDAGTYNCYSADEWEYSVEHAPLNERAWVLQEKLLSPRIVHFAETQVFFECMELRASERSPSGIPGSKGISTLRDTFHAGIRKGQITNLVPLWHDIVSQYTSLELSHHSDKMIAVSAISTQLSKSISHSGRYINGLWEESLLGQLCWSSSDKASRSLDDRAPTWSWGSMNGHASPHFINLTEVEARGEGKAVAMVLSSEPATDHLFSGSPIAVKYGLNERLHISAPLLRVNLVKPKPKAPRKALNSNELQESRLRSVKLMNDIVPGYTGENLMSFGMSSNGLPTGSSGRQRMDMDVNAGIIVQYDEDEVVGQENDTDNPRRKFLMDFGFKYGRGAIQTDQDMEWEELDQLESVFMPVFCTYERPFPEIEILRGLLLTKVKESGTYRRIGTGMLDEYSITAFLCALGNQEKEMEEQISTSNNLELLDEAYAAMSLNPRSTRRLKLEDIVPEKWGGKGLDFVPNDFATYEVTII
ncbi:HET-domain-containing protein [Xylaria cf. heliscus]|nr:HET-domain-containing protein [Xylaria cf. heliscus]